MDDNKSDLKENKLNESQDCDKNIERSESSSKSINQKLNQKIIKLRQKGKMR